MDNVLLFGLSGTVVTILAGAGLVFLGGGACILCSLFTTEKDGPEDGYVADVEHDSSGATLHGWRLQISRWAEAIFDRPCKPINKLLGRE